MDDLSPGMKGLPDEQDASPSKMEIFTMSVVTVEVYWTSQGAVLLTPYPVVS